MKTIPRQSSFLAERSRLLAGLLLFLFHLHRGRMAAYQEEMGSQQKFWLS